MPSHILLGMLAVLAGCGMSPKEMRRAVHAAAEAGDAALVAKIVKKVPELAGHRRGSDGRTPLHLAASEAVAKLLLDAGADPSAGDQNGNTPLHTATSADVARLLLERGAKAEARNSSGATPLHVTGDAQIAELLLAKGADRDAKDERSHSPLQTTPSGAVARLLVERGASLAGEPPENYRGDWSWYTPFMLAVSDRRGDTAAALLDLGADLPADLKRATLVLMAVKADHRGLTEKLIARGLDVNEADGYGVTPLHEAALRGRVELAEVLLDAGADPNAKLAAGVTLNSVVQHRTGNAGQTSFGMESKAISGATPLQLAESEEMKALLRKRGAAE